MIHVMKVEEEDEKEHLSIAQIRAWRKRDELSKSIFPIAVIDPKGKTVEVRPSKKQIKKEEVKAPGRARTKKRSYCLLLCLL